MLEENEAWGKMNGLWFFKGQREAFRRKDSEEGSNF